MGYEFTVERASTYLLVRGSGDHSVDNMRRFLVDAYRAALEHDCDTLLMEIGFSGRSLSIGNIYSLIVERSSDGSRLRRIACVDSNPDHSHSEFAEMAAVRMGISVRFYPSVAAARRGLQEQ